MYGSAYCQVEGSTEKRLVLSARLSESLLVDLGAQGPAIIGIESDDTLEDDDDSRRLASIRLCATSLVTGERLWEALRGEQALDACDGRPFAARGSNLYLATPNRLVVLDVASGRTKWSASLPDAVETNRGGYASAGIVLGDPTPSVPGAGVVILCADRTVLAFDRETGRALWDQTGVSHGKALELPEAGLVFLEGPDELYDPRALASRRTILAEPRRIIRMDGESYDDPRWKSAGKTLESGQVRRCDFDGRFAIMQIAGRGFWGKEGVVVFDLIENRELRFESMDGLDRHVTSVKIGENVFAATGEGARIVATHLKKGVSLPRGVRARSMFAWQGHLLVCAKGETVSLIAFDPATLSVRFALQDLGRESDVTWKTAGDRLVVVSPAKATPGGGEMWAVDALGERRWSVDLRDSSSSVFSCGSIVAAVSSSRWTLARPSDGRVIARVWNG